MNRTRDKFLSDPAFTADQDGRLRARRTIYAPFNFAYRVRLTDHFRVLIVKRPTPEFFGSFAVERDGLLVVASKKIWRRLHFTRHFARVSKRS